MKRKMINAMKNGYKKAAFAGLALTASAHSMAVATVSPEAQAMTDQIGVDAEHYKTWALALFTTLFLVSLLIKMSKKWGNKATSA